VAYHLGVDLGTTFVAAAVSSGPQVEMFTLGDRSVVTPAVVYLREDGAMVTGEAAQRRSLSDPERAGREFKRRLGDPTPVMLGGSPHRASDLMGTLLRAVLTKVTETEGVPPHAVVLTHPANWGPFRRGLFEEVPRLAGLVETVTITEPEAAAAHYASSRDLHDGDTVAVYDLGGGTFDVTVLRKAPGGVEIVGTPEGIERMGGIDFDEALFKHVDHVSGGAISELDPRDPRTVVALSRLRQDCVLAKETLSADTETVLPVFLPGHSFDVTITRAQFEDLVRAHVESTVGALSRALRSARVGPDDLSAVLLVGGSSRIPLVSEMVSEELGRPTVVDTHPKYAVALGAATVAGREDGPAGTQATRGTGAPRTPPAFRTARPPENPPQAPPAGRRTGQSVPAPADTAPPPPADTAPPPPADTAPPQSPPPQSPPPQSPPPRSRGPVDEPAPSSAARSRRKIIAAAAGLAAVAAVAVLVVHLSGADPSERASAPGGTATEDGGQGTTGAGGRGTVGAGRFAPFQGDRACSMLTATQAGGLGLRSPGAVGEAPLYLGTCSWDSRDGGGVDVTLDGGAAFTPANAGHDDGSPGAIGFTVSGLEAERVLTGSGAGASCVVKVALGAGDSAGSLEVAARPGSGGDTDQLCRRAAATAGQVVTNLR